MTMFVSLAKAYNKTVLSHPLAVLIVLVVLLCFFAYHTNKFQLDASADSLMLEDDKDLKIFREMSQRYEVQEMLMVTFTPHGDLFSPASLNHLKELKTDLANLERVDSVSSVLDMPLLKSSGVPLSEISPQTLKTLQDPAVDKQRAKKEFMESPIYKDLFIGADGRTTALLIYLKTDPFFSKLIEQRDRLNAKKRSGELTREEHTELKRVLAEYDRYNNALKEIRHQDIEDIRATIVPYKQYGRVHLGGVPMITDDMLTFIRNDLIVFGFGVFVFIVITLAIIFREVRWVVLPLLNCFFSVVLMIGLLGILNWKVTVISSNFISLMLILTLETNIHLAVRYRQLCRDMPDKSQQEIVFITVKKMVSPCLYTVLTTILGFMSLILSDIRPVIDFGWMMTIGLTVLFLTSFLLFPAVLVMLKKSHVHTRQDRQLFITDRLALLAKVHGGKVIVIAVGLAAASIIGIYKLQVENSFINYFREKTEIYKGLKLIDEQLGGTTPLDIILHFGKEPAETDADAEDDFSEEDDFGWVDNYDPRDYWFTPRKVNRIKQVHDYLERLPGVGKVLSLASIIRTIEELNEGKSFDSLELGVLYKKVPEDIKSEMVDPYISFEHNEARINLRILDSRTDLRRKELLERIDHELQHKLGLAKDEFTVSGLLVLYNNMLQSLFRSQIATLGIVMLGIAIMLFVLFRSLLLAVIGIIPNILAVGIVLGMMGLMNIPLDMMTITIAAITMGIAIDNSIHYIYRFREEFYDNGSYPETLDICHRNVGKAVLNASITIIFGFSILVLSNFIPSIYFGIFTGIAIFFAMFAVLTLMPKLILAWKPFRVYGMNKQARKK